MSTPIQVSIFVQRKIDGKYHVWKSNANRPIPMPPVNSWLHYGWFDDRGAALCQAHDAAKDLSVIELNDETYPVITVQEIEELILSDIFASQFATLTDYRKALIKSINRSE